MKALSIRQPWAWLVAHGHKDVENRVWETRFRGAFLIHAGKAWGPSERADLEYVREKIREERLAIVLPERFELGGIIGQAEIMQCVADWPSTWFSGPFGFVIQNARPLPFFPCRGMLSFFTPEGFSG